MRKSDFIEMLAREVDLPMATVQKLSNRIFDEIAESVRQGGRVEIRGFGVFFSRTREPRLLHSPRNRELIEVPARRIPRFRAGKALSLKVNAQKREE